MRIRFLHTFFHPDTSSGGQLLGDIAFHLASRGHDIEVVATRGSYDGGARTLPSRETINGVRVSRMWSPNLGRGSTLARAADLGTYAVGSAAHALTAPRVDRLVFFTHPPLLASIAPVIERLRGEPYIVVMMDLYPHIAIRSGMLRDDGLASWFAKALNVRTLRGAEQVVVLGRCMAREVAALGVPQERITTIQNWVDDEVILPIPSAENVLRQELGLSDAFVVMYSGNMGLGHRFEDILGAARRLKARKDIRFVFIGGGMRRGQIAEARDRHGLDNLILMDYLARDRLRYSLPMADAHFVSLRTGFEGLMVPSKAYGVMAAGRPLLYQGSATGEIALMLAEEGGGVVIEEGDEPGLTNLITSWADDRRLGETHGARGRAILERTYSKARALRAYERACIGSAALSGTSGVRDSIA
jgi:colanic acid biosynthesis glycosyl transferase WcaI